MPFLVPIITGVGSVISGASAFLASGTFLAGIAKIGLSLAANALLGMALGSSAPAQSVKQTTSYGGDLAREVILGTVGTAGQHIYRNYYGEGNRRVGDAVKISDFRVQRLTRIRYEGKWKAVNGAHEVQDTYTSRIVAMLHRGLLNQAADTRLVSDANPAGRWSNAHRGAGLAYVRLIHKLDAEKLPQPWQFFWEVLGPFLYDWRKDSTVGGAGADRWDNPDTWSGRPDNPILQMYALERGIFNGTEMMVGKGVPAADLPLDKWTLAANICDENVAGKPRFSSSIIAKAGRGETHAANMLPLLDACAATWVETFDGEYPIVGVVQSIAATITDDDIVVGAPYRFSKKRPDAELVNTAAGSFADPDNFYESGELAWRTIPAALAEDGERRAVSIPFPAVTAKECADRLLDIAVNASRFQANAEITIHPRFLEIEPGQWIRWNSAIRGDLKYVVVGKSYGPIGETGYRDIGLQLKEVGEGVFNGTGVVTPPPTTIDQGGAIQQVELGNLVVAPVILRGTNNVVAPGFQATWIVPLGDETITDVEFIYWPTGKPEQAKSVFAKATSGRAILQEGILSSTDAPSTYQLQYRLLSTPPRTPVLTTPQTITAPVALRNDVDFEQISKNTEKLLEPINVSLRDQIETLRRVAREASNQDAGQYLNHQQMLTQVKSIYQGITAEYQLVITAATGPGSALVQRLETLEATIPGLATVSALNSTNLTVSNLNGSVSALGTTVNGLQTTVGNFSASGLFRTSVVATEAGAESTIGISVSATAGGVTSQAAILMSAIAGGDSMVGVVASKFYMTDGAGSKAYPFVVSGGVARFNLAHIGDITAGVIRAPNNKYINTVATGTQEWFD